MADYFIELSKTISLHFNKAQSIINDLFESKKSTVDTALDKIGDLIPIPFFKTAMTFIKSTYKLYSKNKEEIKLN